LRSTGFDDNNPYLATSSEGELFMKKRLIFTAVIYFIFAPWCYGQTKSNPQVVFGEIDEVPLKEILLTIYKPYRRADIPISLRFGFDIEKNGSLSKISLIRSSGDKMVDKIGIEILSKLSDSHLFGVL